MTALLDGFQNLSQRWDIRGQQVFFAEKTGTPPRDRRRLQTFFSGISSAELLSPLWSSQTTSRGAIVCAACGMALGQIQIPGSQGLSWRWSRGSQAGRCYGETRSCHSQVQ